MAAVPGFGFRKVPKKLGASTGKSDREIRIRESAVRSNNTKMRN
jgi:hypothetical protein